jgi:hypothetical protein
MNQKSPPAINVLAAIFYFLDRMLTTFAQASMT